MVLFNEITCCIYLALVGSLMLYEFMKMFKMPLVRTWLVMFIGIFAIATTYITLIGWQFTPFLFIALLALLMAIFVIQLLEHNDHQELQLGKSFLALFYIIVPLCLAIFLAFTNTQLIMSVFILIWISDTAAYLVGSKFGKNRLFERISPKKSWEGAIGSFVITVAIGSFGGYLFPSIFTDWWQWSILAVVVNVFSVFGDLIESMFKRSAGVKDSGNVIPGHGGMLDRLDSFIFAVPWVFITFMVIKMLQ